MTWMLVPDELVWVFLELMISWDFHISRFWCHQHVYMDMVCIQQWGRCCNGVGNFFFGHFFYLLIPIHHHLNATCYLSIVAEHVHSFMSTIYPSSSMIMHHVTSTWIRISKKTFCAIDATKNWDRIASKMSLYPVLVLWSSGQGSVSLFGVSYRRMEMVRMMS